MGPNSLTPESSLRLRIAALIRRALADESGATAIEYALIAAGISLAIAATVGILGSSVLNLYQNIANLLS